MEKFILIDLNIILKIPYEERIEKVIKLIII